MMKFNIIGHNGIQILSQRTAVIEITVDAIDIDKITACIKSGSASQIDFHVTESEINEQRKIKMLAEIEEIQNRINNLEQPQ